MGARTSKSANSKPQSPDLTGLSIANHPPKHLPGPALLHHLVQTNSKDGQPALDFLLDPKSNKRVTLSYAQLHAASDVLACRITALLAQSQPANNDGKQRKKKRELKKWDGKKAPQREAFVVPILIPQSPMLYVSQLAILKAGGAFCPLNLDVPLERARFILQDVNAHVVITTKELEGQIPGDMGLQVLLVTPDTLDFLLAKTPTQQERKRWRVPKGDDLAYVMYTSGSTGTPKGVGISHTAATQSLLAHDAHIPHFTRFLQFAAPTFDVSVFEIFFPLFRGQTLVGCVRQEMLNDLPGVMNALQVDGCELTPSVAGSLLRKRENVPGLRVLLTIGEMLTRPVVEEFGGDGEKKSLLWGMYGPTEAAIHCSVEAAFESKASVSNIGVAFDTVSAFILKIPDPDAGDSPTEVVVLPLGETGELALGGPQLAVGYLNRPDLTSTAFIDTPYGRLYRTGDKARMLPGGKLECLGRIATGQVKLRGQRIELGEVEHAALRAVGCHGAVAGVVNNLLVLFCAVDDVEEGDDNTKKTDKVLHSCREWLPGYMIPNDVVIMRELPRLPSGKVDRKGLVADYSAKITSLADGVAYADARERRMCEIAGQVLSGPVYSNTDLARAGLDSLTAIKLASALREGGYEVSALDVLSVRTIAGLYTRVKDRIPQAPDSIDLEVPSARKHPLLTPYTGKITSIIPCTPLQSSMLAETVANPRVNCNWVELRIVGHGVNDVRVWFERLIEQNEILRTGFIHHAGHFLQVIFSGVREGQIAVVSALSREWQLNDDAGFLHPFKIRLVPSEEGVLVTVQLHHAIYDGWTQDLLLADLTSLSQGQELTPRPQFRALTSYFHSESHKQACNAAREFWARTLHSYHPPPFPTLVSNPDSPPSVETTSLTLPLSPGDVKSKLQSVICTPQSLFLASLTFTTSLFLSHPDIAIGVVTSLRTLPLSSIEALLGPCIATLPLRTDLRQVRTVRDLLATVQAANRAAMAHGVLPLGEIKKLTRQKGGERVFEVMGVWQESLVSSSTDQKGVVQVLGSRDYLETKVFVEMEPRERELEVRVTWHGDVVGKEWAAAFGKTLGVLTRGMLDNLSGELSQLKKVLPEDVKGVFDVEKAFEILEKGDFPPSNHIPSPAQDLPSSTDITTADEWSPLESLISDAVCSSLTVNRPELRKWTPLAAFGLDSLTAIQLAREIETRLGRRPGITLILRNATVAKLAQVLAEECLTTPVLASSALKEVEEPLLPKELIDSVLGDLKEKGVTVTTLLPCTPLQEGMLLSSSGSGSSQYLNQMLFRLNSPLNPLKQAFTSMVVRHPILRTIFLTTSSTQYPIIQAVLEAWEPVWHGFGTSPSSIENCLEQQVKAVPPALDSLTPAISFGVIHHGQDTYISFVCHHALYDGVAIQRLLYEVEQTVAGQVLSPPSKYDSFLRLSLALPADTDTFWRAQLEGYTPKLASKLSFDGLPLEKINLIQELGMPFSQLQGRIRQLGITLLTASHTSWTLTLSTVFNSGDICFGTVINGRSVPLPQIDELVAPCFNTIPIRVKLEDETLRVAEVMRLVGDINERAREYQFTGLRRIQGVVGKGRVFDTLVLVQAPGRELDQAVWRLEKDEGEMDIPYVLEITPNPTQDKLVVRLHAQESPISSLLLHLFLHTFNTILAYPHSHLPLILPTPLADDISRIKHPQPATEPTASLGKEDWTPTELTICSVLTSLSHVDEARITRHTTIYQLGLDSISAVQIASKLRNTFSDRQVTVTASDVLTYPTCARLAAFIDAQTANPSIDIPAKPAYDLSSFQSRVRPQLAVHGIDMDQVETLLPCTPTQSAMLAQFIKSSGKDYLNFLEFEVSSEGVASSQLADTWHKVCAAQPMLRAGVIPVEGVREVEFGMVVYKAEDFSPRVSVHQGYFEREKWRREAQKAAYDNPETNLWSVAILEREKGLHMHLAIHHALYDVHSLRLLLASLSECLSGRQLSPQDITPAVVDILSQTTSPDPSFWTGLAEKVVVNRFPVMTPLQQRNRTIETAEMASSLPVGTLEKGAMQAGYTLHTLFSAAWTRVLSSYLGESSVVFGIVLSGRTTDATREAVFPCICTLPVVAENTEKNEELLRSMLRYNTALYTQQHLPLTRIQQWLGRGDTKLFDTLLVYQKLDLPPGPDSETRRWKIVDDTPQTDIPLSLEIEHSSGSTSLSLLYRATFFTDILPPEQAALLLKQFDAQVSHLALHPDETDSALNDAHPELYSILLAEQPTLSTEVKFLHEFVSRQAALTPEATALWFVDRFDNNNNPIGREWTYLELEKQGNRVAHLLSGHVSTGDVVAVCFDKSPVAYFSILGVLKAGCAFLALDPGAPRERNEFILRDSGATMLLTDGPSPALGTSIPVLVVTEALLASESLPPDPVSLTRDLKSEDVAYILYTSGTTGTPKGCCITHSNTVQCMLSFQVIFTGHWTPGASRWLQFASLHFDVSVLEQYWSWSAGITLVSAPRDLILSDLAGTISRLEITHIDLTPSLARLLHPEEVPSLCRGVFITGGEALKQEILDVWGETGVIYNFYGPTEATIGVTVYPRVPKEGKASNIGRQFINVGAYVLKPGTEEPVLRGGVGELCVSGPLVGKGYLQREGLTREKFPTLSKFGERVYRTGDLVRVLHDGCFDFLGRADDQVKLRGQRLEIGEINHAIRKGVPEIKDVATLVVRNEAQKKDLLVSFVVPNAEKKHGPLALVETPETIEMCQSARSACRSKLPGYMVPTYVLPVPYIPLSRNNKAELKELRRFFASLSAEQLLALSSSTSASHHTLDATGVKIVQMLSSMTGVPLETVKADATIFELGIDSISVLRLSRLFNSNGFPSATPALILRHPVVADLARALSTQQRPSSTSAAVQAARLRIQACAHKHLSHICRDLDVRLTEVEYIAPCSPLQEGMLSRSGVDGAYFNTFRLVLADAVNLDRLEEALKRVVDKLPILRTKFVKTTDGFMQVALRQPFPGWEVVDGNVREIMQQTRKEWIALNQETFVQPWKAVLVGRELVLHIFHALYDANSLKLMLARLAAEYRGEREGDEEPSFLEALVHGPLQDFSESKGFWVEHLKQASLTPVPRSSSVGMTSVSRTIAAPDLDTLRSKLGTTYQSLLQALWASLLSKHLNTATPTMGLILSGRTIALPSADLIPGPMFNTLPFCAHISSQTTWSSLVKQCHDFNTAVLPFQHVPLREVQKWCTGGRKIFEVLFSFQIEDDDTEKIERLWRIADDEQTGTEYPLALEITLREGIQLKVVLVARGAEEQILEKMADELESGLHSMLSNPDAIVSTDTSSLSAVLHQNGHASADGSGPLPLRLPNGTSHTTAPFVWTPSAQLLRQEIASLAETDPSSVSESTPLLSLGLDSIDIIKLSARLKSHGIEVKTSEILRRQTIASITQLLQSRAGEPSKQSVREKRVEIVTTLLREHLTERGELQEREVALPVTAIQEALLTQMLDSDFTLYFNHDILAISSQVDIPRYKSAWSAVLAGEPILRTRFTPLPAGLPGLKSTWCQVISPSPTAHIVEVELQSEDELSKLTETATIRARQGAGKADLVQLAFATVGEKTFVVLSLAHALYDGWSLGLIHRAVWEAYEGRYSPPEMDAYLGQVQEVLLFPEDDNDDAAAFWAGFLQGTRQTLYPRRSPTPSDETHRAELASSVLPEQLTAFLKSHAITLQTLTQSIWSVHLACLTASLDTIFATVLSLRTTPPLENLPYPTMNTVAVRSVLHGTVANWLHYMQENMASVLAHGHFPLREALRVAGLTGGVLNTLFIAQRSLGGDKKGEGLASSVGGEARAEYPVCVEVEMVGGKLVWRGACEGAYGSQEEIDGLLRRLDGLLAWVLEHPDADVVTFSGDSVQICGLPPIRLRDAQDQIANGIDDTDAWSPLEEQIRDALASVAGIPASSIARSNNVYHLGLDSISAIKATTLLRKQGVNLGLRDMLRASSIAEMAPLVRAPAGVDMPAAESSALSEVEVRGVLDKFGIDGSAVEDVLPAMAMQVHMLSVWLNTRGEVFYPEFRYTLSGKITASAIDKAWKTLVGETPILRTVFVATESRDTPVMQVVLKKEFLDESVVRDGVWMSKEREAEQPYNRLVATKEDEKWRLRMKIHHALYDAVSLPAIMERFAALCSNRAQQPVWPAKLPRPLLADKPERKRFWTKYLTGAETVPLCLGSNESAARVSLVKKALPDVTSLSRTCKANGISLQSLFFAAYAEYLSSLAPSRSTSVVFGVYLANRTDKTVGAEDFPTLRLVPIKAVLREDTGLVEVAKQIQEDIHVISAVEHIDVGLWEIQEWTGVVVNSFVNFLGAPVNGCELKGVKLEVEEVDWNEERPSNAESWVSPRELEGNLVRGAFPDAVDIEVSVLDGMTIGVFGPPSKLGSPQKIIDGVVAILQRI